MPAAPPAYEIKHEFISLHLKPVIKPAKGKDTKPNTPVRGLDVAVVQQEGWMVAVMEDGSEMVVMGEGWEVTSREKKLAVMGKGWAEMGGVMRVGYEVTAAGAAGWVKVGVKRAG